jgi:mitochondrial fission protein ELM1
MKPLSVVAYFDGRLGHEKQTSGILHALADITPLEVVQNRVSTSPVSFCKNWASYLLSSLHQPEGGGFSPPADLIIGTGTHTHIPMLLEKKSLQKKTSSPVPVVTCMNPDPQLFKKIDLCFVPIHDEVPAAENVFTTLGPPNTVRFGKAHQHDRGLILIGGIDKKSHAWNTEVVVQQIQTIINREKDIQWTISSSPRTPEDTCRMLEEITTARQRADFFRSADTPAGWVEKEYARNTIVWVTADSISMVYEALTAGCSVGILPVYWKQNDNKFQKSLSILHNRKMTVTYSDWLAGAGMPEPPEEPFNEAGRCAIEILRRWWTERLSRS